MQDLEIRLIPDGLGQIKLVLKRREERVAVFDFAFLDLAFLDFERDPALSVAFISVTLYTLPFRS